jgi:hypothetical protein
MAFYRNAVAVIRDGTSRVHQDHLGSSWREPTGYQAVVRATANEALVVAHAFANPGTPQARIALPAGEWRIAECFTGTTGAAVAGGELLLPIAAQSGRAVRLIKC